jgi:DtxR family Mn-dependent transcriptional regulator
LYWRWKRVNQRTEQVLIEDALKHMQDYAFQGKQPTIRSLAGSLNVSTSQAVEVITHLQTLILLEMQGEDFSLTKTGREYALRIIRAHRIYERYLADQTGFEESEWHARANLLEHHLSTEEVEALAQQLGNPSHDPHGTPIPTTDGKIVFYKNAIPLTQLEPNTLAQIVHMKDEPEVVYAQLVAEGLHIGQEIRLVETSPQSLHFWTNDGEHVLAPLLASNIDVVAVEEEHQVEKLPGQSLTKLKPGQSAQVVGLSPRIRGVERRRLMDLGLLPGTTIEVEMESVSGNPIAYRIRGAVIALRKNQAALIKVCPDRSERPT